MPDTAIENKSNDSELYVGYLPVPRAQRQFLRIVVPWTLCVLGIAAFFIARTQRDPGSAVWDDANVRTFVGTIVADPYAMLFADDRGDGKPGVVFLVEEGKRGAGKRAASVDGKRASVSGTLLHREGRHMLELAAGEGAVKILDSASEDPSARTRKSLGRVTLRGEIVDSKCYLGAMKPGNGKTHKECAMLCISGGIPPMLVTRGSTGERTFYLLTNTQGGPLDKAAHQFIADAVEISGELEEEFGMLRLRVRTDDILRL